MSEKSVSTREIFDAIDEGNAEYVASCLRDHRDIFLNRGWVTWIESSAMAGRLPILKLLVGAGADVNEPYSDDSTDSPEGVIDLAAAEGHLEVVKWLLDHGARINHIKDNKTRCFTLNNAARAGHLDVVKLLIERGAAVNAEWAGMTPLDHALTYNKQHVVDYLRSVGAKTATELV